MSVTNETFVGLQEWGIEVRKACLDKSVNLHTVSEAIGHSYSAITSLISGRVVKTNYLEVAKKINEYLGISVLPEKPKLPSAEWCAAVRAKLYILKMSIGQLSEETGFSRDRLSLVLNGHTMDDPVIERINEVLKIEVPVVPSSSE
nr:MAG TPA: repressor protein [Caudoviricetes sp.]